MQFFVLRVASNKEERVREALMRKVKIEGVEETVGRILVPTERVRSMKGGVRKESDRKLYPGYVFIELTLDHVPQREAGMTFFWSVTTGTTRCGSLLYCCSSTTFGSIMTNRSWSGLNL